MSPPGVSISTKSAASRAATKAVLEPGHLVGLGRGGQGDVVLAEPELQRHGQGSRCCRRSRRRGSRRTASRCIGAGRDPAAPPWRRRTAARWRGGWRRWTCRPRLFSLPTTMTRVSAMPSSFFSPDSATLNERLTRRRRPERTRRQSGGPFAVDPLSQVDPRPASVKRQRLFETGVRRGYPGAENRPHRRRSARPGRRLEGRR